MTLSEVSSPNGNLLPSPLQKHDESIAPSLSQGSAVLGMQMVVWATPTPLRAEWNIKWRPFTMGPVFRLVFWSQDFGNTV